ncbi:mannose-6-phosphate isomerase-like protein (cupin superfamily) [Bradyrhizobium sp. USDA 4472]
MATYGKGDETGGAFMVLGPEEGQNFWQPVPSNGHISVRVAPKMVEMEHPIGLGTQTLPPGCYVREHVHDRNEEVLHFISGTGKAVVEGVVHPVSPGTTIYVGKNRRHKFINDGETELHWLWLIVPNGLEDFFEAIGRSKVAGETPPAPFPRPENVLEIERQTVFGVPIADKGAGS